ncbi:hypothetical protein ACFVRD_15200 [Streptomyces sp. NPDC057908]|uniref:hypothetical protein n=1 Tax=Streptomyces sp. NPDC057908 TaxID=3346276 RepID=UPI0036EE6CD5
MDVQRDLLPKLGAALKNLAVDLGTERRTEEALAAIGEAIGIFGAPVKGRTRVHRSELDTCSQVEAWLQRKG